MAPLETSTNIRLPARSSATSAAKRRGASGSSCSAREPILTTMRRTWVKALRSLIGRRRLSLRAHIAHGVAERDELDDGRFDVYGAAEHDVRRELVRKLDDEARRGGG